MGSDSSTTIQKILNVMRGSDGKAIPLPLNDITGKVDVPPEKIMPAIQRMLDESKIKLVNIPGAEGICVQINTAMEVEEQKKLRGLDPDDRLVLQIIEESSTNGAWIRDIRSKSGLQQPRLTKVLKNLESKQLIKSVKTQSTSSKKMYILFNLSPSEDVTGGAWYTDGVLDEQLVETMRTFCIRIIEQRGEMSLDAITTIIKEKFTSEPGLGSSHMKQILHTLMYDGLIDEHIGEDDQPVYVNLIMKLPSTSPLSSIPCGQCPVIHECAEGNDVSPSTC